MAWALRSLCGPLLSAHLLTTSKLAVVWPAAIMRPLGETGPGRLRHQLSPASIYSKRHRRLGGCRPPTSGTGYIPVHCLLLLSAHKKGGECYPYWWYTSFIPFDRLRLEREYYLYVEKNSQTIYFRRSRKACIKNRLLP